MLRRRISVCVIALSTLLLGGCKNEPTAVDLVRLAEKMVDSHNHERPMDHLTVERITPGECSATEFDGGYLCEVEIITKNAIFGRASSTFSVSIVSSGAGSWTLISPPLLLAQSPM